MLLHEKTLFEHPKGRVTRWFTQENPDGRKGEGGKAHKGCKGAPCYPIRPGETLTLVDADGPGIIREIWLAGFEDSNEVGGVVNDLLLECFWDDAQIPAVSADVDGFFCQACAPYKGPFENALFWQPDVGDQGAGNVGNCIIPMPFRSHARITLTNRSRDRIYEMFYCIEATFGDTLPEDVLYFHCLQRPWERTILGEDYEILPEVKGSGRYLGANIWVRGGAHYADSWFGEGEIKIYLDGDTRYPTLVGTGTEDYIMTACGMVPFSAPYGGCTAIVNLNEGTAEHRTDACFYRLHIPDPVWFNSSCRVALQQMGGATKEQMRRIKDLGGVCRPIMCNRPGTERGEIIKTYIDMQDPVDCETGDIFWINYLREDDMACTVYYFLDRP